MEELVLNETVKHTLITAGLTELEMHGIADFSLRRVAANCNVSCAAPYKHFKDKQHFISEIIGYVDSQWKALCSQVLDIFDGNPQKQLIEMCTAFVKFCIGNSHFRAIFIRNTEKLSITKDILMVSENCFNAKIAADKAFRITALVLGSVMLTGSDMQKNEQITASLKDAVTNEVNVKDFGALY